MLLKAARTLLEAIRKDDCRYAKAGIILADFYDRGVAQPDLFTQEKVSPRSAQWMATLDKLNLKHRGQIYFVGERTGIGR